MSLVARRSGIPEQALASVLESEKRKWMKHHQSPHPISPEVMTPVTPVAPPLSEVYETTAEDVKEIFFWLEQLFNGDNNSQVSTGSQRHEKEQNLDAWWKNVLEKYEAAPKNLRTSITTKLGQLSMHSSVIEKIRKGLKKFDASVGSSRSHSVEHRHKFMILMKSTQKKRAVEELRARLDAPSEDSKLSSIDEDEEEGTHSEVQSMQQQIIEYPSDPLNASPSSPP